MGRTMKEKSGPEEGESKNRNVNIISSEIRKVKISWVRLNVHIM